MTETVDIRDVVKAIGICKYGEAAVGVLLTGSLVGVKRHQRATWTHRQFRGHTARRTGRFCATAVCWSFSDPVPARRWARALLDPPADISLAWLVLAL